MEEDIKILEENVITLKKHIKNYEESDCKTNVYQRLVLECKALENLLKRYKELEEKIEKQELAFVNGYMEGGNNQDNIWRAKIQNKIDELEKKAEKENLHISFWVIQSKIRVLQEILGDRGK